MASSSIRQSGNNEIPRESNPRKPPIAKKPVFLNKKGPGHENVAKLRAKFDKKPNESLASKPSAARSRPDFIDIPPAQSFAKIRDALNQRPELFQQRKPPLAKKPSGVSQISTERPPGKNFSFAFPAPLPPPVEDKDDLDSTVYSDPWSPNFPFELPVRTPTDAEMKAAGSHPFPFRPHEAQESTTFPPSFKYDFGQGFANPGRIRSQGNLEYHLDTRSPQRRLQAPVPPRRPPSVAALRTVFSSRDTDEDQADFSQGTNPFAKSGPQDPYVGSSFVGLTAKTFQKFIKDVDAAFVLFYDPNDNDGSWAKISMKKAAQNTKRENHAYAVVDCTKERELCRKQKVLSVPTMKLFVKGMTVDTYGSVPLMPSEIRKLVENAPIVREAAVAKNLCHVQ